MYEIAIQTQKLNITDNNNNLCIILVSYSFPLNIYTGYGPKL